MLGLDLISPKTFYGQSHCSRHQCFEKRVSFYSVWKMFEKHLRNSNVVKLQIKIKEKHLLLNSREFLY